MELMRRSVLCSLGALLATPLAAKAGDDPVRRPTSIFARHPRHRPLDGYYPAFRYEKGERAGEVWFTDHMICWNADEAKKMASSFLAMTPSPFDRSTITKATGPVTNMGDYFFVDDAAKYKVVAI